MPDVEPYRTPWRRDYARLIHCPSFRRLQGKTQVFPGNESDFYRNRLTHSLEVAQIAKSIAIRLNATCPEFKAKSNRIEPDIVEFAGLAHDLGHPPFGHNGEEALDECMRDHGGFEGNAQTLRIVSRLEKKAAQVLGDGDVVPIVDGKDLRCGLNLTFRSLAALLKYDRTIPERDADRDTPGEVVKGYYADDADLVSKIKKNVLGVQRSEMEFKTIECSIMDIADDIAYSTYDLEDNLKARFVTPMGLFALDKELYEAVAKTIRARIRKQYKERAEFADKVDGGLVEKILFTVFKDILFGAGDEVRELLEANDTDLSVKKMLVAAEVQAISRKLVENGYERTKFTASLVGDFISKIEIVKHQRFAQLHQVRLEFSSFLIVEVLKNVTYHAIIRSPWMQVVEYRGKDIVQAIFRALVSKDGARLLPEDFRAFCSNVPEMIKHRAICDFIAGMTDRYAFEFYGRLYGTNSLTIHKPL